MKSVIERALAKGNASSCKDTVRLAEVMIEKDARGEGHFNLIELQLCRALIEAVECLRFYENKNLYIDDEVCFPISMDCGEKARTLLEKLGKEEG
jgi:hypothetical protein